MTINEEHFLLIFVVAFIFFSLGQITGCSMGEMVGDLEFRKGQQSCKVCEVIRYGNESEKGK